MARHELLLVRPLDGAHDFPANEIEAHLSSQRFFLRGTSENSFLLCGSAQATQFARVRILSEPDEPMPPVVMIRVNAGEIQVWQRADEPALRQAEQFTHWLLDSYSCRVFTPEGEDISNALEFEYAG